ncbi:MAG: PRC-barrel domain-containing protein [Candidatus Thermoplasmatota archaeon]|jgi:sporulation protein YlmC with PRC-barrel domain|nr:PRC-barrel domain-containing protein [Candidatus Thermoplasmatota archaeon]MCL5963211.1 PRC-barrel domain-containing protein [Candidatus Thermoplasmatota archaeon]
MEIEATALIGLRVFTPNGISLGDISNVVIDMEEANVNGLFVPDTNPVLVEGSKAVNVPYRWVQGVGDVIILKHFPKRVSVKGEEKEES